MSYSQKLRELFPGISLDWEDLLLLETFQIKYLPDRVPKKEFVTLLRTYPIVHRFLVSKYPPINTFLDEILKEYKAVVKREIIDEHCQEALWEIADQIIYNKHPEQFDDLAPTRWEIAEISSITSLDGMVVADVGAGSGRIAFLVAPYAKTVFAVEPVTGLRTFMKEKAFKQNTKNVFVVDGTLDSIPLPDDSLDVLITSNAIGWNIQEELKEIERVTKPGGYAIHLLQSDTSQENPMDQILSSEPWNYQSTVDSSEDRTKIKYYKNLT